MGNKLILGIREKRENMEKEELITEIISTQYLSDCEAADVLWATITKIVNITKDANRSGPKCQILGPLIEKCSEDEMKRLLKDVSVDSLVFLDPPLETTLSCPKDDPDDVSTMRAVGTLRSSRDSDPKEAFVSLVKVLERICSSGLKNNSVSYDNEILSLTRKILYLFCILIVSKLP